jgi:ABC-type ATPase with predicted acetyltransferase domain
MNALLAVRGRGVRHRFGETVAVDGVDFEVAAGTVFGLIGPNGASKTTTIRMITTFAAGAGRDDRGLRVGRGPPPVGRPETDPCCCIKAKGVLTKHQSSGADPSDTVENYNKPGISKV